MNKSSDTEPTFSVNAINDYLDQYLQRWELQGEHICRRYKTNGWKSTLMVINTVGHLAEVAWHHPEIEAGYSHVVVKLTNHSAKGITAKDFELAQKIEETVLWRPGLEESALTGTPEDKRFAYVVYEDS